jgi:hypothetical protein
MRLTELQADLKQAVEVEDYANVAELMPKIKQLKATIKAAAVATDKESDFIPLAEMGAFLRSRGDLPEERIESIVTSMDINGNGRIDLKGWRRGWKLYVLKDGMAKEVAEEVIKEVISNAIDEVARVAEIAEVIDEVIGEAAQANESAAAGRLQLISLLSKVKTFGKRLKSKAEEAAAALRRAAETKAAAEDAAAEAKAAAEAATAAEAALAAARSQQLMQEQEQKLVQERVQEQVQVLVQELVQELVLVLMKMVMVMVELLMKMVMVMVLVQVLVKMVLVLVLEFSLVVRMLLIDQ